MNNATGSITAVVVYGLIIMAIGIISARKSQKTAQDYFLGNRGFGTFILLMTISATFFSMYSFLGAYGITYRTGVNFLNQGWWMLMFIGWSGYVFGSRIWLLGRRFGFITPADLLSHYYGGNLVRILVAIIGILAVFPYAAIQFSGVGKVFESFTGGLVPYIAGVLFVLIFTAIYTLIGGMRAVAWTDAAQGLFFSIIMVFITIWAFGKLGGIGPAFTQISQQAPELLQFKEGGWPGFLNLALLWGISFTVLPHIWQRWYAADSLRTIYRTSWLMGVFSWFLCIPIMMIGVIGKVLMPDLSASQAETLLPMLLSEYLPIMGMFVVAGAFAAAMSTIDSMLLTVSSIFEEDIYAKYINPEASEAKRNFMGKVVVAGFTVLLLIFVLTDIGSGLILPIANAGVLIGGIVLPSLVGPLFWPRATKQGAIASLLVGLIISLALAFPSVKMLLPKAGYLSYPTYIAFGLAALTFWLVSILTKPLPYSKQEEYHGFLSSVLYTSSIRTERAYDI
jgi:SSS family solute:Na+ symporter